MKIFRLCGEAAMWFMFVALVVSFCDADLAARPGPVPLWRVAVMMLAGCAGVRLAFWINALATDAWTAPRCRSNADGLMFAENMCQGCGFGMPLPESHGKLCPRCGQRVPSWKRMRHATSEVMCHPNRELFFDHVCGTEGSGKFCGKCGAKMPAFDGRVRA